MKYKRLIKGCIWWLKVQNLYVKSKLKFITYDDMLKEIEVLENECKKYNVVNYIVQDYTN